MACSICMDHAVTSKAVAKNLYSHEISSKFVVFIEFPLLCYIAVSGLTLLQLIAKAIIKYKEFTPG